MTPYGGASSDVKNSQSLVGQLRRYYDKDELENRNVFPLDTRKIKRAKEAKLFFLDWGFTEHV
ncbi:hypothetical protein OUZ56_023272 [Daphnia magna]|uniref:Uncharacterized protein n=1 Tax=Daphnia magna TaxID=35525 RepID=A0ABR0AYS2_9CRUS|nr:hypothetical protein OUZ56_023272 [Daphnia magna]